MQTIDSAPEDLLLFEDIPPRATAGKRLANYLIDIVIFYLLVFVFILILNLLMPTAAENLSTDSPGFSFLDRLISLGLYALYMSVVEIIFKGKSIGKFITKTRAVNLDGSRITSSTAFARGFSRAVPFCPFSAFGTPCNPWQDRWTKTMVVEDNN